MSQKLTEFEQEQLRLLHVIANSTEDALHILKQQSSTVSGSDRKFIFNAVPFTTLSAVQYKVPLLPDYFRHTLLIFGDTDTGSGGAAGSAALRGVQFTFTRGEVSQGVLGPFNISATPCILDASTKIQMQCEFYPVCAVPIGTSFPNNTFKGPTTRLLPDIFAAADNLTIDVGSSNLNYIFYIISHNK